MGFARLCDLLGRGTYDFHCGKVRASHGHLQLALYLDATNSYSIKLTPRLLFLCDGLGALVTALVTGGILVPFAEAIGLPRWLLQAMSVVAVSMALFSFWHYHFRPAWQSRLRWIAVANVTYGLTALIVVYHFRATTTAWGATYFVLEAGVLFLLAAIEWPAASR